jgi:hypothetical protein
VNDQTCRTTQNQQCRTLNEEKCTTTSVQQCSKRESVCTSVNEQVCTTTNKEECREVQEEVCEAPPENTGKVDKFENKAKGEREVHYEDKASRCVRDCCVFLLARAFTEGRGFSMSSSI